MLFVHEDRIYKAINIDHLCIKIEYFPGIDFESSSASLRPASLRSAFESFPCSIVNIHTNLSFDNQR